jgi:small subunit ribosomal protein S6
VYYETTFIVNPDISQEKTQELTDQLVAKVEKAGGRIVKREYWGVRPLAYPIEKRKRGHYVLLVTDGEAAAVQALETAIQLEERILRFLTVRLSELSDEPSPLVRRRKPRSEEAPAKTEAEAETEAEVEAKPTADADTDTDAGEAAEA